MKIAVHCRCAVARTIDTDKVGPYRLRCTTCKEIIYDPAQAPVEVEPQADGDEESTFQRWLQGSAELKVLLSSDGDQTQQESCPTHKGKKVVAACNSCGKLLCRSCLDRVGESFSCSSCIAKQLREKKKASSGGLRALFARLFGR